ncbi:hypothetical protein cyc_05412 [Cyclospora cayetanensis]|uniref:Uncharacterized protein n=1 Tax=Cyclospora cayetanensis TaxID=88456 RepID=A0A1D3D7M8_9EIME|nr:hypothetical protein cyc_05412 [Cyclospora cayetanensis]
MVDGRPCDELCIRCSRAGKGEQRPRGPSLNDFAFQEELDVREQINKKLKDALEAKTREAEAAKTFFVEADALLRPLTQVQTPLPGTEDEDGSSLVRRVSDGLHQLLGSLDASQQQLKRALAGTLADRQRLQEIERHRDALRVQTEAQQQSLDQLAALIDGLNQRCNTLEAERREWATASSTTVEGSSSSFQSLFASWGEGRGEARQRRVPDEETGDVLSYTLSEGLEETSVQSLQALG